MLSIYKPDQGYWTRLLSALGFGALIAWGAMWLWEELGAYDVPDVGHRMVLSTPAPEIQMGDMVDLYSDARPPERIGVASVKLSESETSLVLDSFDFTPDAEAEGITETAVAMLAPQGADRTIEPQLFHDITQRQGIDAFEPIYLQGGVAIGVIVLGALLVLYLCYVNRRTVEFLIATEGEMKKVNWSSRREVLGSTWVVIGISIIIAAILLTADIAFSSFFQAIDLLEQ